MNALTLAQEIINGGRITREDDLSFFLTCDRKELCEGADRIRAHFIGDKVDLCSIINGRSGAARRTANTAPSLPITIQTVRFTTFCRKSPLSKPVSCTKERVWTASPL